MQPNNSIIKFADNNTVVGLITINDEREVRALGVWSQENNLTLNVNKTKEMIGDFRKQQREHPPIHVNGTAVENVESFKFLGVHIMYKLKWSTHTDLDLLWPTSGLSLWGKLPSMLPSAEDKDTGLSLTLIH